MAKKKPETTRVPKTIVRLQGIKTALTVVIAAYLGYQKYKEGKLLSPSEW